MGAGCFWNQTHHIHHMVQLHSCDVRSHFIWLHATELLMRFVSFNLIAIVLGSDLIDFPHLNLLQTHVAECATLGKKPYAHGRETDCCPGLSKVTQKFNGSWTTLCEAAEVKEACSANGADPYATGKKVDCCSDLKECENPKLPGKGQYICAESCGIAQEASCLCIFDIDRTLTAQQGSAQSCSGTKELEFIDKQYGSGYATLSPLSVVGIRQTFCKDCYLGIASSGDGSGTNSEWNRYILDNIMRTDPQDHLSAQFPFIKNWSFGTLVQKYLSVKSPFVLSQPLQKKHVATEEIRRWYERTFNFTIPQSAVHFFDDRSDNIRPFRSHGSRAKEVSCTSREKPEGDTVSIGVCGATPEEIVDRSGVILCDWQDASVQQM